MQLGGLAGDYSHSRWEEPILGINGEGHVSPLVVVIQNVGTVIAPNGEVVLLNNIAKNKEGMITIDMQPLNPHTSTLQAKECDKCHKNAQTMGFGCAMGLMMPHQVSLIYGCKRNGRQTAKQTFKTAN